MRKAIYILVVLALASCKKESYPEPVEGQPVFKLTGTMNGAPFLLEAGRNDIFMNSSADQNNFGVYEFDCQFNQTSCTGCGPVMEFLITNNEAQPQGQPCQPTVLQIGEIQLATEDNSSNFLEIHFQVPDQSGNSYEWNFGDSHAGSGDSPHHDYDNPGLYTITLDIDNGWGPDDDVVIQQQILVGTAAYISMPFNVINYSGDEWEFEYDNLPPDLEATSWTINGVEYYGNDVHYYGDDIITAVLHFNNTTLNQTGFYSVRFDGENNGQISDFFSYQWEAQSMNFGKAECRFRHSDGTLYTSVTPLNDNSNSYMEITGIEEYAEGIDGAGAKKILAKLNVWLVNSTDPEDVIHFENVTATIGFAIE